MSTLGTIRIWVLALCAATLLLGADVRSGKAATFDDPEFVFFVEEDEPLAKPPVVGVPPGTGIHDACGLGVDPAGSFYLSDYYHRAVDLFQTTTQYLGSRLSDMAPLNGPCGLAIDSKGMLYVNVYHQSVIRFTPSSFPAVQDTTFGAATTIDSGHSTGVAVNLATNNVYVDDRTYVAAYDPSGAALYQIGLDNDADYYGLAVSRYIQTSGYVYVSDAAATDTVKVFDPATDKVNPVATIGGPPGGFASLRDSALAVDRTTGDFYVADRVGSRLTEHPETAIYVFDFTGAYQGRLKYNVVDGTPVGLAVDNSTGINQGRVYVTSGNSERSSVYAYGPGSATNVELPAVFSLSVKTSGSGAGLITGALAGISCWSACQAEVEGAGRIPLTVTPDPGSAFAGWSGGGCGGTGACVVTMDRAASVSAEFTSTATATAGISGTQTPSPAGPVGLSSAPVGAVHSSQRRRNGRAAHRHRSRHHQQRKSSKSQRRGN